MSTQDPEKFCFDTVFDARGNILETGEAWRKSVPHEEVEKQIAEALAQGRKDERVSGEQETILAIRALSEQLQSLLGQVNQICHKNREDAAHLAQIIGQKIGGSALQKFEQEHVQEIIQKTLFELKSDPRINIKVSEPVAEKLLAELPKILEEAEFNGRVRIEGDANAAPGTIALQWGDGSVAFDPVEVEKRISTEVENWLSSLAPPDAPSDTPGELEEAEIPSELEAAKAEAPNELEELEEAKAKSQNELEKLEKLEEGGTDV